MGKIPSYLKKYNKVYQKNPHKASLKWFKETRFGLFIHYGLYSLLGRGEWVMFHEKIHVADYEKLKDEFTAEHFDAEYIADLALDAGMKYINITTRHHDSFCLFNTEETEFNSVNSPGERDLVAELAQACQDRGLGLFLYYSYGADWRHPYFHSREAGVSCARPDYDDKEPAYLYEKEEDFKHYMNFVHSQLRELLTNYGPIAGIWFDLISAYYYRPDLFPVEETYKLIRELQPQCLISFKQGVTGDEDYMSQEMEFVPLKERLKKRRAPERAIKLSEEVWQINKDKWNEICTTMQNKAWSYQEGARHIDADDVMKMLANAAANNCNLLLNTGPLPDGSIYADDEATLREVGKRIRKSGFPSAEENQGPVIPFEGVGAE